MAWFLYLIECDDGSLYTGIATDVEARFAAHVCGKGARYTRARKPVRVAASFELAGRSEASRAEYRVKQLTARQKRELIAGVRTLESVMPQIEAIDVTETTTPVEASTSRETTAPAKTTMRTKATASLEK
jgi:putative endonuclease